MKSFTFKKKTKKLTGHCIKCDASIFLDSEHPLCEKCFAVWNIYADRTYEQNFCHACGKKNNSSMAKPTCYSCYKKKH